MILIILSEYLLSFKLINSDKNPHNGLLSEADSYSKPDNVDSDKSPLRTRDLESFVLYCFDFIGYCHYVYA